MEPAQILITILMIGVVGSILLTFIFFFIASTLVECPECRKRVPGRHVFCRHCGERVPRASTTPAGGAQTVHEDRTADALREDCEVRWLFDSICQLPPAKRSRLNVLMRTHAGGAGIVRERR